MKYQKKCECCGHVVTAYTHKLWKQQVEMLRKLIRFNDQKHRPAIISEIGLTPVQYSIFSKMKHWKFIQTKEIHKEDWETTMWRIATYKARQFIGWKIQVENRVASMNWKTLSPFHEAWTTDEQWRKMVYVWEISDEKSKQPEEYKKEKGSIFRRLFE